jgi:undecaprenyl-diphosphatase
MVPAGLIGLTMKDWVDSLFTGNLVIVGSFLFVTAALLMLSQYFRIQRTGEDDSAREVTFGDALVIGVGQALAILPGLSRSGTTISTALLLGVRKTEAAHFSFLMVIPVIAGQLLLDVKDYVKAPESVDALTPTVLLVGMVASFIVGLMACKWMIRIVRQGSMTWFAVYCIAAGSLALYFGLNGY